MLISSSHSRRGKPCFAVCEEAETQGIPARKQAGPVGGADGEGAEGVVAVGGVRTETIHVRRLDRAGMGSAHSIGPPLIRKNKQQIFPLTHTQCFAPFLGTGWSSAPISSLLGLRGWPKSAAAFLIFKITIFHLLCQCIRTANGNSLGAVYIYRGHGRHMRPRHGRPL